MTIDKEELTTVWYQNIRSFFAKIEWLVAKKKC